MRDAKVFKQPITSQYTLSKEQSPKTEKEIEAMKDVPYSNAIGSVIYLMVSTRPYLGYATSVLSKYMENPGKFHWLAMKWVFRFLLGTTKVGLVYKKQNPSTIIEGYSDSYYVGDRDNRRSTSAYLLLI
ncbi:hypothetical protein CsatA_013959 [Cannabis sativa]